MSQQNSAQVVYLDANTTGNGLLGGGPTYARIEAGSHFTAQLKRLSKLCNEESLTEVRISYAPDMWGPEGIEEDLRTECPELVVTKSGFWFVDRGRHSDAQIQTSAQSLKEFFEAVAAADGPIYLSSYPSQLKATVLEDEQQELDDEEREGVAFR